MRAAGSPATPPRTADSPVIAHGGRLTPPAPARGQGGFTLTELMVTVAIIGVLATLAVALLRANPRPSDVADQVSNQLREAARKAVSGGALPAHAVAEGNVARTRVRLTTDPDSLRQLIVIDRSEAHAAPDGAVDWVELTRSTVPVGVVIAGYSTTAELDGGGAPAISLAGAEAEFHCLPDATCYALDEDGNPTLGGTIYVEAVKGNRKARVVIMPLGGAPMVFEGW